MRILKLHHLRFDVQAQTHLALGDQPGQQLRGALFGILRDHYCPAPGDPAPGHSEACPVCWLLAREDDTWWRGQNPVRPYTLTPPIVDGTIPADTPRRGPTLYRPGDPFSFGITLFGRAIHLFPFLALAMPPLGRGGVGLRLRENGGERGRFTLTGIRCINPLTGDSQTLLDADAATVQTPTLDIAPAHVLDAAERLAGQTRLTLRLRFLTPTRLISEGRLLRKPHFRPLFGRLIDRIEGLAREYGDANGMDVKPALAAAEQVELAHDATVWRDLASYSSRNDRSLPAGGFIGEATYAAADWRPLLPWLVWGTLIHIGKNAVKGEGIFTLDASAGAQ